jgi:hypothetical protein
MIQIDVHHIWKTWSTHRTHPALSPRMTHYHTYLSCSLHMKIFHADPIELYRPYCSWEKGLLSQSPACRLTDPQVRHPVFSPNNHWSTKESQHLLMNMLHRFTGLISLACDQYVQYLLTEASPLVLNWHIQGLPPWRSRLSTSLSPPFPIEGPLFPLMAPSDLRLTSST